MRDWGGDDWVAFLLIATLFCACWADCITDRVVYVECLKTKAPAECKELKP